MAAERSKAPFIVISAVLFIVALGVGVLIAWPLFSSDPSTDNSKDLACTYVDAVADEMAESSDDEVADIEGPLLWNLMATGSFAMAADVDAGASPNEAAGRLAQQGASRVDVELMRGEAITEIRDFCDK